MTSDARAAIRHSITRIESSLDRVAPRLRGGLDEVLTGLRHRLDALPPVGGSIGEAASKGAHKAEAAAQAATGRLAEAAEHLADAVSHAPVPANTEGHQGRAEGDRRHRPHGLQGAPAGLGRHSHRKWCSGGRNPARRRGRGNLLGTPRLPEAQPDLAGAP